MTPETQTLRTDAQPWINRYPEYQEGSIRWVSAAFARQLERELATERALADRLAQELEGCAELTSAHEALAAWKEARK